MDESMMLNMNRYTPISCGRRTERETTMRKNEKMLFQFLQALSSQWRVENPWAVFIYCNHFIIVYLTALDLAADFLKYWKDCSLNSQSCFRCDYASGVCGALQYIPLRICATFQYVPHVDTHPLAMKEFNSPALFCNSVLMHATNHVNSYYAHEL